MNKQHANLTQQRIASSFSRASTSYDQVAFLQRQVGESLLDRLSWMKISPRCILDLGAGTSAFAQAMSAQYPGCVNIALDAAEGMLQFGRAAYPPGECWVPLCADAAQLPLATDSVDLVFSSLMLQWAKDLPQVIAEVQRVLVPGGLFIFSTLGPGTLRELAQSWQAVGEQGRVNEFIDMHDVGDLMRKLGLSDSVLDTESLTVPYASVTELLRELQALGSVSKNRITPPGLSGRQQYAKMIKHYEQYRTEEAWLPASYEVIYGHGWKQLPKAKPTGRHEVSVPLAAIKKTLRDASVMSVCDKPS